MSVSGTQSHRSLQVSGILGTSTKNKSISWPKFAAQPHGRSGPVHHLIVEFFGLGLPDHAISLAYLILCYSAAAVTVEIVKLGVDSIKILKLTHFPTIHSKY